MKSKTINKVWESVHIYYQGDADLILKNLVSPYLSKLEKSIDTPFSFFFVRYFEDGYHIRLRMQLNGSEKNIANELLKCEITDYNIEKNENIFIKNIPYIPEIRRYGNKNTIRLAEQQFEASSRTTLAWLNSFESISLSAKYLQALKLHIKFFKETALTKNHTQHLCSLFIQAWLPRLFNKEVPVGLQSQLLLEHFESEYIKYRPALLEIIPQFWDDLDTHNTADQSSSIFTAYRKAGIGEPEINDIIVSFIHMTNNRVGLSNKDESFIIYLVKRSLTILTKHEDNS